MQTGAAPRKVESIEELFSLVWHKVDPDTGKSRSQEENAKQLKEYASATREQRLESALML